MTRFVWTYQTDLTAIKLGFEGLTAEGIAMRMFNDVRDSTKVNSRIHSLKLSLRECRNHNRDGSSTPEQYLRSSHFYAPMFAKPKEAPAATKNNNDNEFIGMPFVPLIMAPEGMKTGPSFYMYAASKLDEVAERLRREAARILEEKMSEKKVGNGY